MGAKTRPSPLSCTTSSKIAEAIPSWKKSGAALAIGSRTYTIPKPPWKARKLEYLDHLREAPDDVRLVSAADKLHNVRTILADFRKDGDSVWDRFSGHRDGTLWYYRAVLEVLREGRPNRLVEELHRVVTELETLATNGSARSHSLP